MSTFDVIILGAGAAGLFCAAQAGQRGLRVLLIDQATYVVVRETWSDASTGAYSFDHIDPVPHYLVIAFDHTRQHRAVIADNLRAQPMTESQP